MQIHDLKIRLMRPCAERIVRKLYREGHPLLIEYGVKDLPTLLDAFDDFGYFQLTTPTRALFTWQKHSDYRLYYMYGRRKCYGDDLRGYLSNHEIERALGLSKMGLRLVPQEGDLVLY